MASFDFDASDFYEMLNRLADPEAIAKKMIEAATPTAKAALTNNTPEDTGELKKSIRASKIMKRNGGLFRVIRPTGVNNRGDRNADVAAWKNYGTSKMRPEYFIEGAASSCSEEVFWIMNDTFYKEVGAD